MFLGALPLLMDKKMDFSRIGSSLANICCIAIIISLMLPWLDWDLGIATVEASGLEFMTGKEIGGTDITSEMAGYLKMWPIGCAVIAALALFKDLGGTADKNLYMIAGIAAALSPVIFNMDLDIPEGADMGLTDVAGIGVWLNCAAGALLAAVGSGKMADPMKKGEA